MKCLDHVRGWWDRSTLSNAF